MISVDFLGEVPFWETSLATNATYEGGSPFLSFFGAVGRPFAMHNKWPLFKDLKDLHAFNSKIDQNEWQHMLKNGIQNHNSHATSGTVHSIRVIVTFFLEIRFWVTKEQSKVTLWIHGEV